MECLNNKGLQFEGKARGTRIDRLGNQSVSIVKITTMHARLSVKGLGLMKTYVGRTFNNHLFPLDQPRPLESSYLQVGNLLKCTKTYINKLEKII